MLHGDEGQDDALFSMSALQKRVARELRDVLGSQTQLRQELTAALPELLQLVDRDRDGRATFRELRATAGARHNLQHRPPPPTPLGQYGRREKQYVVLL